MRVCWALAQGSGDLESVARFLALEPAALQSIGLERKARPVPSRAEYLAARAARQDTPTA